MDPLNYAIPAAGVFGLLYAAYKANWVLQQDAGEANMQEIARRIEEGANKKK